MPYSFITQIKNVKKHSNADKLNIGECFGNQVIISLETQEGDLGVYFPTDTQLGMDYAIKNNLIRTSGGYLEDSKRNIRTLKLRGEISDGLFMPIKSLESFIDINTLKVGDSVDMINGVMLAQKYIPTHNHTTVNKVSNGKSSPVKKVSFPLFKEHVDTSQYAYNKHVFKEGDLITISLKLHGTSGRVSHTIKHTPIKPTLLNKILIKLNLKTSVDKSYGLVSGTRRVVLDNFEGGYHGGNNFRKKYHDMFEGKLAKGESVYMELVGYDDNSRPIMSVCDNGKTQDKEFIKQYGKSTTFSYGCNVGENDMYVYRMSMTNEDGHVVEYPTWLVKQRCEEMGVKFVPVLEQFFFTTLDDLEDKVNKHLDGTDPIGKNHIREGVVIRIENKDKFVAYKNKGFNFKCLESIIKNDAIEPDMEEAQELIEEDN